MRFWATHHNPCSLMTEREVGICLTVAALSPRVASKDEAVAWNVERVKTWLEGLALNGVELRVN